MNPDDPLLKILACPLDKGPLHLLEEAAGECRSTVAEDALYNPRLRRRYPIVDGIPQLLPSSGEQVTDDEHERLLLRLTGGSDISGSRRGPQTPGRADAHDAGSPSGPLRAGAAGRRCRPVRLSALRARTGPARRPLPARLRHGGGRRRLVRPLDAASVAPGAAAW